MRRVDVADQGPDATRMANALRDAGYSVEQRDIEDLVSSGTDAPLVIIAGDAGDGTAALQKIRAEPRTQSLRIVLVGSPRGGPLKGKDLRRLGADAFLPRPVNLERLVEQVGTLLADAPEPVLREPTVQLSQKSREVKVPDEGEDDSWRPPEPSVVRPDETTGIPASTSGERAAGSGSRPTPVSTPGPSEEPAPAAGFRASIVERPARSRTDERRESTHPGISPISPWLQEVFQKADRRLFPGEPPMEIRLAIGDESAMELVTDELLESVDMPIESVEDPLEAFTFLGAPPEDVDTPLPLRSSERGRSATPAAQVSYSPTEVPITTSRRIDDRERTAAAPAARTPVLDALDFGEVTADGTGRRGDLADAGALALLWALWRHKVSARLVLDLLGGPRLSITLVDGRVAELDGPVALGAVAGLRRDGMATDRPMEEEDAQAVLADRLASGVSVPFDIDRRLARAREEVLHSAVAARGGSFHVRPLLERRAPPRVPLMRGELPPVLMEGARRLLTSERVRDLLGGGVLSLAAPLSAVAAEASLEPEVVALLVRSEGAPLETLMARAPAAEGLPGVVFALSALGAIRLVPGVEVLVDATGVRRAVQAAIESVYALAEDGDYFALLGVGPAAGPRELRVAYEGRRKALTELALVPGSEIARQRDVALDAVEEAFALLSDDRLREAYRRALSIVPLGDPLGAPPGGARA